MLELHLGVFEAFAKLCVHELHGDIFPFWGGRGRWGGDNGINDKSDDSACLGRSRDKRYAFCDENVNTSKSEHVKYTTTALKILVLLCNQEQHVWFSSPDTFRGWFHVFMLRRRTVRRRDGGGFCIQERHTSLLSTPSRCIYSEAQNNNNIVGLLQKRYVSTTAIICVSA